MVEAAVVGIALDSAGQHVILLKPAGEQLGQGQILPIWIGPQEATSILAAVSGAPVPRPFAHDLLRSALDALDATMLRAEVTGIEDGTYYAVIVLKNSTGEHIIDARPSDAIALASRTDAALWVAQSVFDDAGIPDTITAPEGNATEGNNGQRIEDFRTFLDTVDPEDFRE